MDLDNIASGFADNDYSLSGITLQPLVDDDGERSSGSITGFIRKALPDGYGPVDFSNAETLQLNSAEMSLEQNHENLIILTDSVPPVYTQVEIVSTSSINGLDEDSCRTSRKRKFDDGITMTESGFSTTRQQCEVSCSYCDRKLKSESSLRRHVTYVHDLVEEICKVEGCPHVSRTRLEHNTHVKTHKNHERKILRLSEAAKVRTAENVRNELARYYVTLGSRKENATTPDVSSSWQRASPAQIERQKQIALKQKYPVEGMTRFLDFDSIRDQWVGRYRCVNCSREFSRGFDAKRHAETHRMRAMQCKYCPRALRGEIAMRSHVMKYHAADEHRFACKSCGLKFLYQNHLHKHLCSSSSSPKMSTSAYPDSRELAKSTYLSTRPSFLLNYRNSPIPGVTVRNNIGETWHGYTTNFETSEIPALEPVNPRSSYQYSLRAPDVHLNPNTSTITCSWSIYTSSDIVNKSINSRNTMEEHCYSNSLLKKERGSIGTRCSHTTTTGFGPVYSNSRPLVRCIFSDLRLNAILHHYQIDMTTANIRLPTRIGANALDGSASVKCVPETSITTACVCPISSIILSTLIVRDNLRQQ